MAKKDNSLMRIFLNRMRSGDIDYVDALTDDQLKDINPFVLTMHINGAVSYHDNGADAMVLKLLLVDIMSGKIFDLQTRHRRLLLKTMVAIHQGLKIDDYNFIKPSLKQTEDKEIQAICSIYGCNPRHAKQYYNLVPKDALEEVMEYMTDV